MPDRRAASAALAAAIAAAGTTALADEKDASGIRDNSFFVEEAYNQEPGVVQHVFNAVLAWDDEDGSRTRTLDFTFTQEWPLGSEKHQFSYTVPASFFDVDPDGGRSESEGGVGDVLLNYRYQVADGTASPFAFAPRASLVLPTGDEDEGLGAGEFGVQLNLPWSLERGAFAFHANAGVTAFEGVARELPGGGRSPERSLAALNLGLSAIWIESPVIQPMVEVLTVFAEAIDDLGREDELTEVLLSPGFRWAPYTSGASQVVVGAAVPVGLTDDAPDVGLFFYLSIEHAF